MRKTWLITGCSNGLGHALAQAVLERGDRLVATARNVETLRDFEQRYPEHVRVAHLDVTVPHTAVSAVAVAQEAFGGLDVLVNNAGYGMIGAVEEGSPDEYRALFDTNVFGLIEVTKAALPALRQRGNGRIVNLSSGAGVSGSAGYGYYNASKFAVEGLSEALAQEVGPLGIAVIIAKPGPFRTAFLGRSVVLAAQELPFYAETAGTKRQYSRTRDGQQSGDPAKAARVILAAVDSPHPPLHLPVGAVVFDIIDKKIASLEADTAAWRSVASQTDFESAGHSPEAR
ncbi:MULTISPECIES: oxidoreductase [unclassified Pseudomonas]|uniref:oxidoreductase n=1 Tax=unclassified Pseudomonas TaxID=196821 RepID=UPI000D3D1AE3|nr:MULTISPECIES: oxidoreductase [unclassified Pseudomonas]RAU43783.1 SDR family NAD(P)-dependent oxidoreductase [Pseudomonas sp. RIT 409]RAU56324.1 SDR family NAD(P)-dependent oxidoreductase [Pseudomonas sp. RIT 412]